ncbi:GNAT family N-acetyltransferase [Albimonas sp. CAU 1670]|uniref:GNAT family N-acetyltransferase n=1 Tax=Albimonas sp. CAU 1670 TaxID=3032599 RepID=UPI0023DAFC36|nr:GNAT family N-acetyltransferase [Albimonas sp. CAU 1670]MDF2231378.1 GNAT family N-acetyltransferase [Albimonas sp. CAU 1670]
MSKPDETRLMQALEATWPPASVDETSLPGWRLRDGAGGGKRVSAAISTGSDDVEAVAAAMRARGETPLVQVPGSAAALDAKLEAAGWAVVDPTVLMIGEAAALAELELGKHVRAVQVGVRLALLNEIWTAGGIGPERRAVMARCKGPHSQIMVRSDDRVTAVAHVAADGDVAMLHAVEVRAGSRRQGAGRGALVGAARFALENDARWLALAVTEANAPARALYEGAGMETVARYHYRQAK